jgi:excisionase family DNA binding protein
MTSVEKNNMISEGLARVSDAAHFLGISKSSVYKMINTGVLPSTKIGNSRRIPIRSVRELALSRLVIRPQSAQD